MLLRTATIGACVLVAGFCALYLRSEADLEGKQLRYSMYKYEFYDVFRRQAGRDFEIAWNAAHPDDPVRTTYEPVGGDYASKLKTQIVAGTCPDLFIVPFSDFDQFVREGVLLDLRPLVERHGDRERLDEFYPALLEMNMRDGGLYALPGNFNTNVLYYNRTLFDKEGLPHPTDDWNWNDLLHAAQRLTRRDAAGRVLQRGLVLAVPWMDFAIANNGRFWDETHSRPLVDGPEVREAFRFYVDLLIRYRVAPTPQEEQRESGSESFMNGRAAMLLGGRWWTALLWRYSDIDWTVAAQPRSFAGRRASCVGCNPLGIYAKTRYPDLAYRFLMHLLAPENIDQLVRVGDSIPIRRGAPFNRRLLEESPDNIAYLKMTEDLFHTGLYYPPDVPGKELDRAYIRYFERSTLGQLDPDTALAQLAREMAAIVARHRAPKPPASPLAFAAELLAVLAVPGGIVWWQKRRGRTR